MRNTLHFMCGKMAAGKSTLAKHLAKEYGAILLCEDEILEKLYPRELNSIEDYIKYSKRVKEMLKPHIKELLEKENNVVLDFPANTITQRKWFKGIFEETKVNHKLHYVKRSDEVCKEQLKTRNQYLQGDRPLMDETTFNTITQFFQEPEEKGFNIVLH